MACDALQFVNMHPVFVKKITLRLRSKNNCKFCIRLYSGSKLHSIE